MEEKERLVRSRVVDQVQFYSHKGPIMTPEVVRTRRVCDLADIPKDATGLRFLSFVESIVLLEEGGQKAVRSELFNVSDLLIIKRAGAEPQKSDLIEQEVHPVLKDTLKIFLEKPTPPKKVV